MWILELDEEDRLRQMVDVGLAPTLPTELFEVTKILGTKTFMAIGALLGEHYIPMHDLESFFWVIIWICFHWNRRGQERRKVKEFED